MLLLCFSNLKLRISDTTNEFCHLIPWTILYWLSFNIIFPLKKNLLYHQINFLCVLKCIFIWTLKSYNFCLKIVQSILYIAPTAPGAKCWEFCQKILSFNPSISIRTLKVEYKLIHSLFNMRTFREQFLKKSFCYHPRYPKLACLLKRSFLKRWINSGFF